MDYTDNQALPFPAGTDYGAGGRQLQDLAEVLESKMNAVDAGWLARRNPPTWIVRRTSSFAVSISTFDSVQWSSADTDNTGNRAPTLSGSTITGKLSVDGRPETWWVGAYCVFSVGTTSPAKMRRWANLRVDAFDVLTGSLLRQTVYGTSYETNTGGEQMVLEGLVRVPGNATVELRVYAESLIAVNLLSGSLMWATRVGQE